MSNLADCSGAFITSPLKSAEHRPRIAPETYGTACLATIMEKCSMSPGIEHRYRDVVQQLVTLAQPLFAGVRTQLVHGDCHKGNLLQGRDGWFFLDFDDMGISPPYRTWLLLPARAQDCPRNWRLCFAAMSSA
ncbi:MAG: phosphotransferase [Myxococcota bacterium]